MSSGNARGIYDDIELGAGFGVKVRVYPALGLIILLLFSIFLLPLGVMVN